MADQQHPLIQKHNQLSQELSNARSSIVLGAVLHIVGTCLALTISPWWLFMALSGFLLVVIGMFMLVMGTATMIDFVEERLRREFGVMGR